jgi:hypothetical protein
MVLLRMGDVVGRKKKEELIFGTIGAKEMKPERNTCKPGQDIF